MEEFWLNIQLHLLLRKVISCFGLRLKLAPILGKLLLFRYQKQSNGYDFIDYEIKNVAFVYVESG
jgi:hypothetical protein